MVKLDIQAYGKEVISTNVIVENDSVNDPMNEYKQSFEDIQSNNFMKDNTNNQMMNIISSHVPVAPILENIVVIFLDSNNDLHEDAEKKWFNKIQHIVNTINRFTDVDECVNFLTELENEYVLMIISEDCSQNVLPYIEQFHQLKYIYILKRDNTFDDEWTNKFKKVKGVFNGMKDILSSLTYDIRRYGEALTPISIIRSNNSTSISLNELDQSFMYTKLIKEILLEIKYDDQSRQSFIDVCHRQYPNNDSMLQLIDQFHQEYNTHSPIWWYSKETFIYSTVNRALRMQEINTILMMGFFLHDLHCQIEQLYKEWSNKPTFQILYRGQGMLNSEFESLRQSKGNLLAFNSFLSTSTDREVSFFFADSNRSNPDLTGVLFEIKINLELSSTPFIFLDNTSQYHDEKEILFSTHSIFKVSEINQIDHRFWKVELLSTTDNDQEMNALTHYMQETLTTIEINPWIKLWKLLRDMGHLTEAEEILQKFFHLFQASDTDPMSYAMALYGLGDIKICQGDFKHALSIFQKILQFNLPNCSYLSKIYAAIGRAHSAMGNYSAALSPHKKSLEILQNIQSDDNRAFGLSFGNIGEAYLRLGKPRQAILYLKKCKELLEEVLPSNHPELAIFYNWIGEALSMAGDYSHAFIYYEKAFKIQEKYLPPNHIELAHSLNNMGRVYEAMGDLSSALSCHQKTLQIRQNSLNSDHPDIAKTYNNIGNVFRLMGNYLKALSCYQMALNIYEKLVDINIPELAITYHNIAVVFTNMGNFTTALGFLQKTLKMEQTFLSHDHLTLSETYYSFGTVYEFMDDYSNALSFFEKSYSIQEKHLNSNHPAIARTYNSLAKVYISMNDYPNALAFLEKARIIQEKSLHPDHPELATVYANFAMIYLDMKDSSTALSFLEKARIIEEKRLHPDHSELAGLYNNFAAVYLYMKDYSTALSFLEKARIIQEKCFDANHPTLGKLYENIGAVYLNMEDCLTALSFFHKARKIYEKNFPPNHSAQFRIEYGITAANEKMGNRFSRFSFD